MITISVDDGHILDWKSATLLEKYGLTATFYWSKENPKHEVMSEAEMVQFTKRFPWAEIQSHTYSHPHLTDLSVEQAELELKKGYSWLYNLLGVKPIGVCYPRGYMSNDIAESAQRVGFEYGRTVKFQNKTNGNMSAFELPCTHHIRDGKINVIDDRFEYTSLLVHSWELERFNDWDIFEDYLWTLKKNNANVISNTDLYKHYAKRTLQQEARYKETA